MLQKIFTTKNDWTGFILRMTLGIVLFAHGAQKVLGIFGGYGFTGTMGFLTGTMNLPWIVAFLVIIIEFVGAICVIAGFATRVWSPLIIVLMLGIIFTAHINNGFFMNWAGALPGEGYEFHLLIIGMCTALFFNGSGKLSIDGAIASKN